MPKMKTHRGAAKRFRVTGSGKIKRAHAYTSHLFSNKSTKAKRQLDKNTYVDPTMEKNIRALIPYK
ncbi:MAG: 50S ribosomal protein L35 [Symbiobacteriia bacterium]